MVVHYSNIGKNTMLLLNQTRIHASTERKLSAGAVLKSEGAALVATYEDNELRVKPSEGKADEVFVGVAISAIASVTVAPKVEELVINKDTAIVELARLPITDKDIAVKVDGTSIEVGTTTVDATHAKLEKLKLTFDDSLKGKTAVVTYRFSPNAEELYVVQGEQRPGVHVTTALGQTGVITAGEVLTSEFDVAADWTPKANGQIEVRLGANGLFTTTGTGTKLNAVVTRLPVAGSPYLGLQFHI